MTTAKKRDVNKIEVKHKPLGKKPARTTDNVGIANKIYDPGAPGGGSSPPHKKISELQRFLWAEGQQESGGNYDAVNAGSGALGRWQVMPANLPSWLRESGLPDMSADEYLHNHAAQNRLATVILGGDFKRYGAAGAAAVWYSGRDDPTATYGDPPVYVYVNDVLKLMGSSTVGTIGTTGSSSPMPYGNPKVTSADSWSAQVGHSAIQFNKAAAAAIKYGKYIRSTY